MHCARCNSPTLVVDSRDAGGCKGKVGWLADKVKAALPGEAPSNYRVRQRVCRGCGHRCTSVEVLLSDTALLAEPQASAMGA